MLPYHSYLDIDPQDTYLIPLYSVPLLHLKLNNWGEKKSALMQAYERANLSDPKLKGAQEYTVATDFHKISENNDFSTSEIVNEYFSEELEFISQIFNCPVLITNAWFEKSTRNKQHTPHNHGNSGLSCVVFIKFDPKYHCPTVFIDPNLSSDSHSAPLNEMPPGIREGSMIVFPSYLTHYTLPNLTEEDRIILSFNMFFDKENIPPDGGNNCKPEYAIPDNEV